MRTQLYHLLLLLLLFSSTLFFTAETVVNGLFWVVSVSLCLVLIDMWTVTWRRLTPTPPSQQSYALVTGASEGIGKEICRELAQRGYSLILVARSVDKLRELAKQLTATHHVDCLSLPSDLSVPGANHKLYTEVKKALQAKRGVVDLLFNNAGLGIARPFWETDLSQVTTMGNVNMTALVELTHLFLQDMTARDKGRICFVGSSAGVHPMPQEAYYSATKAFVNSLGVSINAELAIAGKGVSVTVIAPGPVKTMFAETAGKANALMFRVPGMCVSAEQVAKDAVGGTLNSEMIVFPGAMTFALGYFLAGPALPWTIKSKLINRLWND